MVRPTHEDKLIIQLPFMFLKHSYLHWHKDDKKNNLYFTLPWLRSENHLDMVVCLLYL